ncbi:protein-disulfide reductase DsbD domain-containing protein [Ignatzschineria indica]|uniref:protein-disulfide reductase DsbD domain-containing protein n=1 Tax=Ignatzschineria indica TaxID=472583 RepID=UPI003633F5ED
MLKIKTIQNWLFVLLLIVTGILFQPISAQTLFNQSQGITTTKIGIDPTKLLKPTEAFIPKIHLQQNDPGGGEHQLLLLWEINPDYYLYKEKIDLQLKNANGEIIDIVLPQGVEHEDEFFGQQEIYDSATIIPFTVKSDGINTGYFNIEAQGCAKSGYCFAPQSYEITLEIDPSIDRDLDQIEEVITNSDSIPEITSEHDRLTQYLHDNEYLAIPSSFYSVYS